MFTEINDKYYLDAIEADFDTYASRIRTSIDQQLSLAEESWQAFTSSGGITGVMRMRENVSTDYRQQAARLSDAYSASSEAIGLASSIRLDLPEADRTRHDEISDEAARQRRWLEDLRLVMRSEVLDAKLSLLPIPEEGNP